jgi:hypothetical protein
MILSVNRRDANNKLLKLKIKLKSLRLADKALFTFLFKKNDKSKSADKGFQLYK